MSLAVALATARGAAAAQTVATPDGRVKVTVSPAYDPATSSGSLGVSGNLGAYGFDVGLEGGPTGGRFVNPPLNGSVGSDGQRYDETFGPPVAHATMGTGGITEGVDEAGRLTGLGWPGPGMYDHVSFIHVSRGWPNQGAPANAGSFGGAGQEWLLPSFGWTTVSQEYASDTTETLVTMLRKGDVEVAITDVVDPVEDLIARSFRFRCASTNPACSLPESFAYYADMNPTTSRVPRVPSITDGALDDFSDFGTVYDAASSAMLHFRPYKVDPASLSRLATSRPEASTALDAVAGAFGPGVYIAVGGQQAATEFQAGLNSGGLVRGEAEGTPLIDPFYDLADGHFSGSPAAFGKTAGGLRIPADDPADPTTFTVYLTAASEPQTALAILQSARHRGFDAVRNGADDWWQTWITRARLPATNDPEVLAVVKHALMLIRTAQDRRTGAIVANATVQTPYRQDWVRDGSFFNYALLLAGYPEMALDHAAFYRRVYRPGGTWDSLYYPDGAEAGFAYPYEIDSQAFALWALWLPFAFDRSNLAYIDSVYPAIRDTADALLLCRDPRSGLQCLAAEDDAVVPTQGAQGASTVYLALRVAAEAADVKGDAGSRDRWNARADELRDATISHLCANGCPGGRGGVYLVWPSRLLEGRADLEQSLLGALAGTLDLWSSFQAPPIGGFFQYPMEPLIALGPFWGDANRTQKLDLWIQWLAHDVVEPGVHHFAERIFYCWQDPHCAPGRRYLHSVGFPHIWSGTEMYIASAFAYGLAGPGCSPGARIGEAVCR